MVKSDPAPGRALDTMVRSDPAPGIALDTPLRLEVAVKLAFPAGGMTVAGLRTEIRRGTLPVENIAGKLFVTLAGIDEMRETCRAPWTGIRTKWNQQVRALGPAAGAATGPANSRQIQTRPSAGRPDATADAGWPATVEDKSPCILFTPASSW